MRSTRFLPTNGRDPVEAPIEGGDGADSGPLRARDQVGVGDVEPVNLVDLHGPQEQVAVEHLDGGEGQDGPECRRHLGPWCLVERLEDVGDLREDQIGQQQRIGRREVAGRPLGLLGRVAG